MRVLTFCVLVALLLGRSAGAQQTIYFKKDHTYLGPGGKEIAVVTPPPSDQIAPTVPSGLSTSNLTSTSVQLGWGASTDSGGSGLAGYKIYRRRDTGARLPVGTVGPNTLNFTDALLQPATPYTYTIVAFDRAENHSSSSNAITLTTAGSAPTNPSNLVATTISTTQVNLSWTASTYTAGIDHYEIQRRFNSGDY
jgi:chitodextrinase